MLEETILITVKTYPTLSKRYVETVCTAGINDKGEWRRLYPIRYRYLEGDQKFNLYDRVEVKLQEASPDGRPESRRPLTDTINILNKVKDKSLRHQWVKPTIEDSIATLTEHGRTIGPVRVSEVLDWYWKDASPD